jgi:hypothetical protein
MIVTKLRTGRSCFLKTNYSAKNLHRKEFFQRTQSLQRANSSRCSTSLQRTIAVPEPSHKSTDSSHYFCAQLSAAVCRVCVVHVDCRREAC